LLNALIAVRRRTPHWPLVSAAEIASNWLFIVLDWSLESSPLLLPQAASKETAKPMPPATSARWKWRIRGVTLEPDAVVIQLDHREGAAMSVPLHGPWRA
jgi:hypothetical protein